MYSTTTATTSATTVLRSPGQSDGAGTAPDRVTQAASGRVSSMPSETCYHRFNLFTSPSSLGQAQSKLLDKSRQSTHTSLHENLLTCISEYTAVVTFHLQGKPNNMLLNNLLGLYPMGLQCSSLPSHLNLTVLVHGMHEPAQHGLGLQPLGPATMCSCFLCRASVGVICWTSYWDCFHPCYTAGSWLVSLSQQPGIMPD